MSSKPNRASLFLWDTTLFSTVPHMTFSKRDCNDRLLKLIPEAMSDSTGNPGYYSDIHLAWRLRSSRWEEIDLGFGSSSVSLLRSYLDPGLTYFLCITLHKSRSVYLEILSHRFIRGMHT